MRTDSGAQRGRGQQNFAGGHGGRFNETAGNSASQSERRFFAKIVLASLLAHGCLVLVFLFLDAASGLPRQTRKIPVELVTKLPAPYRGPADPIKTSHKEIAREGSPEAGIARIAGGSGPQTLGTKQRLAPQSGRALAFDSGPSSFHAVAVPLPTSGGEAMSYQLIVGAMLERVKHYPESALRRGAKGTATVGFALDESGRLVSVSLLRSSGEADLDAESVAVVKRAAPFPAPPPGAKRSFAIEVAFGMGS
ncbi:MAG: energy transducer TonB [Methylocella sp.]